MSSIAISMSIENAEAKYSEKFVKDLEKLVIWMSQNDWTLTDLVTGDSVEWNENLVNFEEPGRNKLESYVKELSKYYSLAKNGEEIDDIKTMIKEFRENKPKRINKIKEKKIIKQTEKKNIKPMEKNYIIKDIIVKENIDIDTEDAYYIDTLEFSTDDLTKIFGNPLKNGTEEDKHQYEWKLIFIMENGKEDIYSIYNWMDKSGNFKEYNQNEWHLATMRECPKKKLEGCECQLDKIIKFMTKKLNEKTNANEVTNEIEIPKQTEENIEKTNDNEIITKNKKQTEENIEKTNDNEITTKNKKQTEENIEKTNDNEITTKNKKQTEENIKKMFNLMDDEDNLIDINDIHF